MARRQIKQAWERLRLTGPGEVRAQPTDQRLNIDRICKTFVVLKREFAGRPCPLKWIIAARWPSTTVIKSSTVPRVCESHLVAKRSRAA